MPNIPHFQLQNLQLLRGFVAFLCFYINIFCVRECWSDKTSKPLSFVHYFWTFYRPNDKSRKYLALLLTVCMVIAILYISNKICTSFIGWRVKVLFYWWKLSSCLRFYMMSFCKQNMLLLWQISKLLQLTNSLLIFDVDQICATEAISKSSPLKLADSWRARKLSCISVCDY